MLCSLWWMLESGCYNGQCCVALAHCNVRVACEVFGVLFVCGLWLNKYHSDCTCDKKVE